ncbi:unnamed protein product [Mytilus coruscus]|uniref:Uncharacterized protein n=1 Tax=Mytilus coruscus TaxID=42192 RepID=A0A6J8F394_MYTCO|nr:unnamed protein product [Mytilus coruscus]
MYAPHAPCGSITDDKYDVGVVYVRFTVKRNCTLKIMAATRASVNGNKVKTGKIKTVAAKPNLAMKTRKTAIKNSMEVKENSKKCKIAAKKPRYSKSKVNTDGEAIVKSVMSADGKMVLETQNSNGFSQLANVLCHERKQCKQRLGYHLTPTGDISDDVKKHVDTLKETGKTNKKQKKNNKRKQKSPQKFDITDWEFKSETCSNNEDSGIIKQKEKMVEVVMKTENEISVSDGEDKTVISNSKPEHSVQIDDCQSVTVEELETSSDDTISVSENKLKNKGDKFSGNNSSDGNNDNTSLDKAEDSNHAYTKKTPKYQRSYAARCMERNANSSVNQKGYIKNDIYEQLMKSCQDKLKSGEVFPFTDPSIDFEKDENIDVDLVESVPMSDNIMAANSLVFVAEKDGSSENIYPVIQNIN